MYKDRVDMDGECPIHTAMPDLTKQSRLCRICLGGVNCILNDSRLSPTENLKSKNVNCNVPFTSPHQTQHRQDRLVVSGGGVDWT